MAVPHSLSPLPLTSLGDNSYTNLFENDYSVGNYSLKSKISSANGGVMKFKGKRSLDHGQSSQEIIFQFPWRNYYLWFGTRPSDLKFHVDFGEQNLIWKQNLFANVRFHGFDYDLRLGTVYNGTHCRSHSRLAWNGRKTWSFLSRTHLKHNDFVFTLVDEFDINNRRFSKYDFLVGYVKKDFDVYLRHLSNPERPSIRLGRGYGIGKVVADFVYRKDKHTFGAELSFNGPQDLNAVLALQTKIRSENVKVKYNVTKNSFGVVSSGTLKDNFGYVLSLEVPLTGKSKTPTGFFPVPVGITLDVQP